MIDRLQKLAHHFLRDAFTTVADTEPRPGQATARLRLAFLAPLLGALLLLIGVWVLVLYVHEHDMVGDEVEKTRTLMERMYRDDVAHHANTLEAALELIGHDEALHTALARRDRTALLQRAATFYPELRRKFGITHFYFTGPDRVNLLRVHQPDRYGDTINRFTILEAERTGRTARGVELGPLGTFTLRLVAPWHERGRLLGYIELGMEIDQILQTMQSFFHAPLYVLVSKEYLKREDWEAGMKMLGRSPEWERFPDTVLSIQASETLPPLLAERLAAGLPPESVPVLETTQARMIHRAVFLPLPDAAGRRVARLVGLVDVSAQIAGARRVVYLGSAGGAVAAALLFAFFYRQVGRVGRRIESDEQALHDIATHDRLTGAWNRRRFDELLAREMARARRYNQPLSLIMFDIDHFKNVNDTYGHRAGDDLLAALSVYVGANVRDTDLLARWGGEEFMLIVPGIGVEAAARLAEKLRALIECGNFGEASRITCSFGVTQFRTGDTAEDFTGRADAAMYRAKQAGRNRVVSDASDKPATDARPSRQEQL